MGATRVVNRVAPLCRVLGGGKERRRALSSGRSGKDSNEDANFESLFSDLPSSASPSPRSPSTGESSFWKHLMDDSKSSTPSQWSFLNELNRSPPRSSYPRAQTSPHVSSFRKLGEGGGLDFLKEAIDRPTTTSSESADKEQSGEEKLLQSASFKLLRDSLFSKEPTQPRQDILGIKSKTSALDEVLGLDSSSLFSSQDTWPKNVDTRTLAEVEGQLYSTMDQSPGEDTKTYTYEELGEKLRQARPPAEQILSSATGLSFGELRARFEKIDQTEKEAREDKDRNTDIQELKESLFYLKPLKSLAAKKQLSYEELAFVNHVGMGTGFREKLEYTPPKDDLLTKYYSDVQLSSKERLKLEIKKLREEFQTHDCDSGSPQVQIAILTARINNLNRHMREGPNYKRDKHSKKGLSDMVQYRKRLLRYLRRRDWPVYCDVLTKLKLDDVILEKRR